MITFLDFFSPLAVPANCRSSQCHTHVVESSDHRPFYIVTEDEKCCPNQKYVVKSEIYKGVFDYIRVSGWITCMVLYVF